MRTALHDVLSHLPEAQRADYSRLCAKYNLEENAAEIIGAAIILEAVGARVDSALSAMDQRLAEFEKASGDLPNGLRAAGAEIVRDLASDIASATVHAVCQAVERDVQTMLQICERQLATHLGEHSKTVTNLLGVHEEAAKDIGKSIDAAGDRLNVHAHDMKIHHASAQSFMRGVFGRLWAVILASVVLSGTFVYAFDHAPIFHGVRAAISQATNRR